MFATETQFTAPATTLTGISRVNVDNRDTCFKCLILDKLLQLPKSPGVHNLSLFPDSFDTVSDVCQIFEDNHITGFAVRNHRLADLVVNVLHPAAFFARETFQCAFGTFRSFALKPLAQAGVMLSGMHYLFARESLAFARGSYIVKSSINTNRVTARGYSYFLLQHYVDIEDFFASVVRQCSRFRLLPLEKSQLEVAYSKLDMFSAVVSSDADFLLLFDVPERPGVQRHRSWLKGVWKSSAFQCIGDSRYCADNVVSLQLVFLFHVVIAEAVELNLVGCIMCFGHGKNIIAAVSKTVKRLSQN